MLSVKMSGGSAASAETILLSAIYRPLIIQCDSNDSILQLETVSTAEPLNVFLVSVPGVQKPQFGANFFTDARSRTPSGDVIVSN